MEILLNGQPQQVRDGLNLTELVESLGLTGRRLAIEVNLEVVPRSVYPSHRLRPGDRVEVVHAIGGGGQDGIIQRQLPRPKGRGL
ncbi:sulfur carrier protein [Gammaproteobacteria bacterium]